MTDLTPTIVAKSDQLNADDLISGPRTITIRDVAASGNNDQPINIFFEGDNGKPYRPCKSMRRVLVKAWGPDGSTYAGRSAKLFLDPSVKFGGIVVGGIRISHLSHIDGDLTMGLTASKGKRAPYKVQPLKVERPAPPVPEVPRVAVALDDDDNPNWTGFVKELSRYIKAAPDVASIDALQEAHKSAIGTLYTSNPEAFADLKAVKDARKAELAA